MALHLHAAGAAARALPGVASRATQVATRTFRGGSRRPPVVTPAPNNAATTSRVGSVVRSVGSGVASTAATVGAFVAADALLSEEDVVIDAQAEQETTRPAPEPQNLLEPRASDSAANRRTERAAPQGDFEPDDQELERELIAYAAEMVMQKVDASPLLDQVAFLTNRYKLTRREAFEVAGGAQLYRFHPEVVTLVAAVSSFNSQGTLLLGAQRANRGV